MKLLNFSKWSKINELYSSSKNFNDYNLLLEAVLTVSPNIISIISKIEKEAELGDFGKDSEAYLKICKEIILASNSKIDNTKNKYLNVELDDKGFEVTIGKQKNEQSIQKVLRNILIAYGINIGPSEIIKDNILDNFAKILLPRLMPLMQNKESNKDNFEIVDGADIVKWYSIKNTTGKERTELANSCMRYEFVDRFLQIYTNNPDKIKLVIKLDENGKLTARALLFKLDESSEGFDYFLDRVYFDDPLDKEKMYMWLQNQPNYKNCNRKLDRDHDITDNMKIFLENSIFKFYPWIDTLCYLHFNKINKNTIDTRGFFISNKEQKSPNVQIFKSQQKDGIVISLSSYRIQHHNIDARQTNLRLGPVSVYSNSDNRKYYNMVTSHNIPKQIENKELAWFDIITTVLDLISSNKLNIEFKTVEFLPIDYSTTDVGFPGGIYNFKKDFYKKTITEYPVRIVKELPSFSLIKCFEIEMTEDLLELEQKLAEEYDAPKSLFFYKNILNTYSEKPEKRYSNNNIITPNLNKSGFSAKNKILENKNKIIASVTELEILILGLKNKITNKKSSFIDISQYFEDYTEYDYNTTAIINAANEVFPNLKLDENNKYIKMRRDLVKSYKKIHE